MRPATDPLTDPDELAWLRRLAGRLVRDDAEADDLAQEAWLRLRLAPAGPRVGFRPWARRALENLLRRRVDGARRRTNREQRTARDEAVASSRDVAETLELHRELLAAVDALPAGLRDVVMLRYLDGLPPREIAARTGLHVRNVETRLRRGLEALRAELDTRHRGRPTWVALWAPLTTSTLGSRSLFPLGLVMSAKTLSLVAVALAVVLTWFLVGRPGRGPGAKLDALPRDVAALGTPDREVTLGAPGGAGERTSLAVDGPRRGDEPTEPRTSAPLRVIRARVVDAAREPLAGIALRVVPNDDALRGWTTDDGGEARFSFTCRTLSWGSVRPDDPNRRGNPQLVADEAGWTTVFAGRVISSFAGETDCTVGLAPARVFDGVVVTPDGTPIPDALIDLEPAEHAAAMFGIADTSSVARRWRAWTTSLGGFVVDGAPAGVPLQLVASAPGHLPATLELATDLAEPLEVVLEPKVSRFEIEGRVLDLDGSPVPFAVVLHDHGRVACDTDGAFELRGDAARIPLRLVAVAPGRLPGESRADRDEHDEPVWPSPIDLRLGGEPGSIEGVLLDAAGEPVSGATIWIAEPTQHEGTGRGLASLEPLVAGQRGLTVRAATAADGAFRLDGLLDRSYEVRAVDPSSLELASAGDVRAGARGVVLRFHRSGRLLDVEGVAVDRSGAPVADVRLRLARTTNRMGGFEDTAWGGSAVTDERGAFHLAAVARSGARVHVQGPGVFETRLALDGLRPAAPLRLVVPRTCRLRVEVDADAGLDADAWALDAPDLDADFAYGDHRFRGQLHEGVSETVDVPDTGRAILLLRGDRVVRRIPVELRAGELNVIRN